jgi:OmpA-OmpF porin, OOP family
MSTLNILSLASLTALASLPSMAQQPAQGGYFGLSLGRSQATIDEPRIRARLLDSGASSVSLARDENSTALKLLGGYQFNPYLALEGGYFSLGKFGYTASTQPAGSLKGQAKFQGVNLDVVGTLPLTQRWSALGRIGTQYAGARDSFSSSGAVTVGDSNPSKKELNYKLGLGAQYAWSPSLLVRAELERYRINDAIGNRGDINVVSLGLVFPFGRVPAPAPAPAPVEVPAPAPVPIAQAPAPVPAPARVPAPVPVRQRVNLSADSLFDFDKAVLRPDGQTALQAFAQQLQGVELESINIEAHTDRLGTESYNQALSLRRAETVKAYLVVNTAIDSAKISTVGKGESTPVTKLEDCKGNKPTVKLIACLQPDRRVVVEVTGTR